jgi:hypothetical protein
MAWAAAAEAEAQLEPERGPIKAGADRNSAVCGGGVKEQAGGTNASGFDALTAAESQRQHRHRRQQQQYQPAAMAQSRQPPPRDGASCVENDVNTRGTVRDARTSLLRTRRQSST